MQYHVFQYALPTHGKLDDLNRFLAANRIVSVSRETVHGVGGPLLVFVVETCGGIEAEPQKRKPRIDYREVLSESDFAVYCALREVRKRLAEAEAVPVFKVFSNAQLAAMVTGKVRTLALLAEIDGVGAARCEQYGQAMLDVLCS